MSQRGGKQSDVLLKQTLDMEKKLSALKNRMAVENEQRAVLEGQKAAKGSYWRSGNAKLGGSLNYARDVKARQKKSSNLALCKLATWFVCYMAILHTNASCCVPCVLRASVQCVPSHGMST